MMPNILTNAEVAIDELEINKEYRILFDREDVKRLQINNLNVMLQSLWALTAFTGREFALAYYSKLSLEEGTLRLFGNGIPVPALGDQSGVSHPQMTGMEYTHKTFFALNDVQKQELLLAPILHMHTHPGSVDPSSVDLKVNHKRYQKLYSIKENLFFIEGSPISAIIGEKNDAFFYRFTGNEDAYQKFYYSHTERSDVRTTDYLMKETGAFKSMYVPDIRHGLRDESLENFISTFCPSTFKIKYRGPVEHIQQIMNTEK